MQWQKIIIGIVLVPLFATVSPRGLENALDISSSGVIAQRMRAQIIAENIANADTLKMPDGLPYRRQVLVMQPAESFGSTRRSDRGLLQGVVVTAIQPEKNSTVNFQRVYNPYHPQADAQGFVSYPNVDLTKELVELTLANGEFENNVVAFNNTKAMMKASLELAQ
jgi:flagellar basal-body rod protein FlgC